MVDSSNPERWLTRATHDLRGARNDLNDDPEELGDLICYECHQAFEKALKAVILNHGRPVPRTHDLAELVDECASFDSMAEVLRQGATLLARYSTQARYPDDLPDDGFTGEQAEAAFAVASGAVEFAKRALVARS